MTASDASPLALVPGRIGPSDAVQLAFALCNVFDRQKSGDAATKRAARAMRDSAETLRVAWETQVRATIGSHGGKAVRRADTDEDAVWIALFTWLKGWASLPAGSCDERERAATVLASLFPDGVSFTDLTYAMEWVEAERRMNMLEGGGYADTIEQLGGAPILRALRTTHGEYERVLGVTHRATMPPDPASDALASMAEDTRVRIRAYVESIAAADAPSLADTLLEPLRRWVEERNRPRLSG